MAKQVDAYYTLGFYFSGGGGGGAYGVLSAIISLELVPMLKRLRSDAMALM